MNRFLLLAVALLGLLAAGCDNIGKAPSGMSENDAKKTIDGMSPEDKIKFIASSPAPAAEKQRMYKEVEDKTGVKAADVLGGQAQTPGSQSR